MQEAERNFAAGGEKAKLVPIAGASHDTITRDPTGEIAPETKAWFARWLVEESGVSSAAAAPAIP